jgi:membrane protease YdiL (CAAX protease family)
VTGELVAVGVVIVVAVTTNVWVHLGPPRTHLVTGPLGALVLVLAGRAAGLSWAQLGLAPDRFAAGLAAGLAGSALLAAAVAIGVVLPATRRAFLDSRYDLPLSEAVRTALVTIPLATVVFEETAFRGVIWGEIERTGGAIAATAGSAALFGVWHVLPALHVSRTSTAIAGTGARSSRRTLVTVLGVVVGTALAGVVLAGLRWWTGSLVTPVLVHWAANGCAVIASSFAWERHRESPAKDEVRPAPRHESGDVHPQGRESHDRHQFVAGDGDAGPLAVDPPPQ